MKKTRDYSFTTKPRSNFCVVKIKLLFLLLLTMTANGCSEKTTLRYKTDYHQSLFGNKKITILPINIEASKVSILGNQNYIHQYEDWLEDVINNVIVAKIQDLGYEVQLIRRHYIAKQKLFKIFTSLIDRVDDTIDELYCIKKIKEHKAFNVNNNFTSLAVKMGQKFKSDILLIVKYNTIIKTSALRVRDFLTDVFLCTNEFHAPEKSAMIMIFIDAKNGDFLWSNNIEVDFDPSDITFHVVNNDTIDHINIYNLVDELMKDFMNPKYQSNELNK